MTWVIGAASLFSTGALISDTRVQFSNGDTAEMLQKAYPVGNYIAAGFAGSVRIGFELIESLKATLAPPEDFGDHACDPAEVAREWAPIAQRIFQRSGVEEQRNGARILLVGISPIEHMGTPEWPRVYVVRLSSKDDFAPGFIDRGLKMCSIGSGAGVTQYKRMLRPLFRMSSGIHQAHMASVHQWAQMLAHSATISVRDYPHAGISEHFHVLAIRLGEIVVFNNDMTTYPPDGAPIVLRMPPVARSWAEFDAMARAHGSSAVSATC
jgi:hypothetical protein